LSSSDQETDKISTNKKEKIKHFFKIIYLSLRRITNYVGGISLGHFRSRSSIFWSIIYPVVLIIIFGAIFGRSISPTYQLTVLDLNDSTDSEQFVTYLDNLSLLEIDVIHEMSVLPEVWMEENQVDLLLIIPTSWNETLQLNSTSNITVYYNPSSTNALSMLEMIEEAVVEKNLEVLPIVVKFDLLIENLSVNELRFIDSFVPGIIVVSISTISLFTGLSYDLEEMNRGIVYKLSTTLTTKIEWILSKHIWQIVLAIISSLLCILFALIYDFNASNLKPMMFLFVFFGTLTFSGLGMILIRLVKNPDGVMFVSLLITIPQILLGGSLIPLDTFPNYLKIIARVFPMFYFTEGIRMLMLDTIIQQFWFYLAIAGVFAITTFTLGIILTKWRKE
jgi:ABC-2 type transport system permease protein